MKKKCKHPDESVITVSGKHECWEGTCQDCGAEVKMVPVPIN